MTPTDPKVWRLRMKYGAKEDLARKAWSRGEAGFWYGAWSAADWAAGEGLSGQDLARHLEAANRRRFDWGLKSSWIHTARQFTSIAPTDFVLTIFEGAFHLGHVEGPLRSAESHPLNREGELFKFRQVRPLRSFAIADLPDSYRLLPSAGQNALHGFQSTNQFLAEQLIRCDTAEDVASNFRRLPAEQLLALLGPSAWESLCLGYLILTENFVPTGLGTGRTLKDFDIVGVNLETRKRILAQCKNDRAPVPWRNAFGEGIQAIGDAQVFLFAWGGCKDRATLPPHVTLIDGADILRWLESERSRGYWDLWTPLS